MILFLHNRYRTTGGEERVVDDLLWLVRERLGHDAEVLARESQGIGRSAAAAALLAGGSAPQEVAAAVRRTRARVVHAHNLHPTFGWRALAAARNAGAKVVLHLHQYRLVCAVGVCFTDGADCTRCHGRNTLPGVIHNCRGSRAEALAYGAALALWQRRLIAHADAVVVPSAFAAQRLRDLGAPLPDRVEVLPPPLRALERPVDADPGADPDSSPGLGLGPGADPDVRQPAGSASPSGGSYALVVSRLAPEKGVDVAIDACARAGRPLVVAGDGPLRDELRAMPGARSVTFAGRVADVELERLRAGAALALVPSRSAETFGLAAAEALAAGVPVVASAAGALPELLGPDALVPPGDASALATAIERMWDDREAARRGRERVQRICSPESVAESLGEIYERAGATAIEPRTLPGL